MDRYKAATIFFAILLVAAVILSERFYPPGDISISDRIQLIGSLASAFGLLIVFVQLLAVQSSTRAAKAAAVESHNNVLAFLCAIDITRAINQIKEAQNYCRQNKHELAIVLIHDIQHAVHQIMNNSDMGVYIEDIDFETHIRNMSKFVASLEKEHQSPSYSFSTSILNGGLEIVLNDLMKLDTRIKQTGDNHG